MRRVRRWPRRLLRLLRRWPLQLITGIIMALTTLSITAAATIGLALVEPHARVYRVSLLSVLAANYAPWPDTGPVSRRLDPAVAAEAARDQVAHNVTPVSGDSALVPVDLSPLPQADTSNGVADAGSLPATSVASPIGIIETPTPTPTPSLPSGPARDQKPSATPQLATHASPSHTPLVTWQPTNTTVVVTARPPTGTPLAISPVASTVQTIAPTVRATPPTVTRAPTQTATPAPTAVRSTASPSAPTATAAPATATPIATPIPPTATATRRATALPTATAVPPTNTPLPTNTPSPTDTPIPTNTPGAAALVVQIVVPSDGATVSSPAETNFRAIAYDPAVGTSDGDGITSVDFSITPMSGSGNYGHNRSDTAAPYCAYGGSGACPTIPNWASMDPGTYRLTATAHASGKPSVTVSVSFTKP